jgi:hypothetical protein
MDQCEPKYDPDWYRDIQTHGQIRGKVPVERKVNRQQQNSQTEHDPREERGKRVTSARVHANGVDGLYPTPNDEEHPQREQ